jgi:hypothetical protein
MQILTIVGWFLALGIFIHLAVETVRNRLFERREKKAKAQKVSKFKKHHHFDEKRHRWVRDIDGAVVPLPTRGSRRGFIVFGLFMLILWEAYWASEISRAETLSQIPYFFVFLVMVGIPLVVYLISRGLSKA